MSDEAKPTIAPNVIPPGTPFNVNVNIPSGSDRSGGEDYKGMSEKQFKERLQEAEEAGVKRLLKDLGIDKKDRTEVLNELKSSREMLVKLKAEADALKPQADKVTALEAELKGYAEEMFNSAPESVQKYIAATTPDDPAARMKALRAAKEAGLYTPAQAFAKTEAPAAPVEQKPAKPSTTMASNGPDVPKPAGTLNHYETWRELLNQKQTVRAAQYYQRFAVSIDKEKPR